MVAISYISEVSFLVKSERNLTIDSCTADTTNREKERWVGGAGGSIGFTLFIYILTTMLINYNANLQHAYYRVRLLLGENTG